MLPALLLRLVLTVLLAVGLIRPFPLVVTLPLLLVAAWLLIGPQRHRQPRLAPQLQEIARQRDQLEASLQHSVLQHQAQVCALRQELEASRECEQRLTDELLQWQQRLESSSLANQSLESRQQQLHQELKASEELLGEAQTTIDQLRREQVEVLAVREVAQPSPPVQVVPALRSGQAGALLLDSAERDLYRNERQNLLIAILQKVMDGQGTALQGFTENRRAMHVLGDLVSRNPLTDDGRKYADKIKHAFRVDDRDKLRANLRSLGFECPLAANGHVIVAVRDDDRYQLQVSSSPSDRRSRFNEATRLLSLLVPQNCRDA